MRTSWSWAATQEEEEEKEEEKREKEEAPSQQQQKGARGVWDRPCVPLSLRPTQQLQERSLCTIPGMGSAMWLLLLALLAAPAHAAAPRHPPVLPDTGGSGDGDEALATPPAPPATPRISPTVGDAGGTTVTNSSAPGVLDGLVDFFKEYLLLVVVVGSLSFVLLFIICAAIIVRQKHKASAYYPSSFPKQKAPLANGAQAEQNPTGEEEKEEEEGSKKLADDQPAKPSPQNPGVEEVAGATGAGGKETPDVPQDGSSAPSGV
ncbi:transmembrane protein 119 isoform X2 [Pseudopipra pipra]|uniref:transmembrane protein 119 isoform X2 n=1 Tax=Pseudopipra pipra TaxID=415032 RepID=UPI0031388F36